MKSLILMMLVFAAGRNGSENAIHRDYILNVVNGKIVEENRSLTNQSELTEGLVATASGELGLSKSCLSPRRKILSWLSGCPLKRMFGL
jgi:hypothetical protein